MVNPKSVRAQRLTAWFLTCCMSSLLGLVIGQSNAATGQLVGYVPTQNNTAVCAVVWPPHVISIGGQLSGYQVDVWKEASKWLVNIPYTMTVLPDLETAKSALLLPTSNPQHCDVMLTSWSPTVNDLARGIRNSMTTFRGGYQLVVRAPVINKPKTWFFISVFSWDLWVALILTSFLLTPFFYFSELDYFKRGLGKTRFPKQFATGMIESWYRSFGKLLNVVDELRVTSLASKAVALTWGMLATILLSVYTAGLTARTTTANFKFGIQSVQDLPNLKVGTPTDATHLFLRYGWIGVPLGQYNSDADGTAMLNALLAPNSTLDALVIDSAWYKHTSFALSPYMDPVLRYNLTLALVDLTSFGFMDQTQAKYMGTQSCGISNQVKAQVLDVGDTAGLWIIVAGMTGLAVLLMLVAWAKPAWDVDVWHVQSSSKSMRSLASQLPGLDSTADLGKQSTNS